MSGETEKQQSAWTTDTILAHLTRLIDAQIAAVREEQRAQKELLQAENKSTATALVVARTELERRLEGLNELRKEVTSDRQQFVKTDVYAPAHEVLRLQRVADNEKAIVLAGKVEENVKDIAGMKSSLVWLTRLIAATLISALLAYGFQKLTGH